MTVRVGIDIMRVDAVEDAIREYGRRYLDRVYTAGEVADCTSAGVVSPERLAARFAAKEAAIKMLSPGADAPHWREIELRTFRGGSPRLLLHGSAGRLARKRRINRPSVSVTHEAGMAAAVVVGEAGGRQGGR